MKLRLTEWRERRGYSLRTLGERAGVSAATLSRIEAGKLSPTVGVLVKLAKALDVHPADFFPPRRSKPKQRG
jgi:transcriptional regulator with XRE-family HTH domain